MTLWAWRQRKNRACTQNSQLCSPYSLCSSLWRQTRDFEQREIMQGTDGHPPSHYTWLHTGRTQKASVGVMKLQKMQWSHTESLYLPAVRLRGWKKCHTAPVCKLVWTKEDTVCMWMKWKEAHSLILYVSSSPPFSILQQADHSFSMIQQKEPLI